MSESAPDTVINQPEKVEINQGEGQQQPEPPKRPDEQPKGGEQGQGQGKEQPDKAEDNK